MDSESFWQSGQLGEEASHVSALLPSFWSLLSRVCPAALW